MLKLMRYLPLLVCSSVLADTSGFSLSGAAGVTDGDLPEKARHSSLNYEYWWDGGFKIGYDKFTAPDPLNNFNASSLGIFYQAAVNNSLIFNLELGASLAMDDTPFTESGDSAFHTIFGAQWRVSNNIALDASAKTIYGLGNLDTFTTFYLGMTVWPFAGEDRPQVFKNHHPTSSGAAADWTEIAAIPATLPGSSPITDKVTKPEPKPVHTEEVNPEQVLAYSTPETGSYYVQIGTFGSEQNVKRAASSAAYSGFEIFTEQVADRDLVRVFVGSFADEDSAKQAQSLIWRMFDDKPLIVKR